MKIIVCVKQISLVYARTGMEPEQKYLAPEDVIYRVNPYDEVAVEMALRMKALLGGEITLLTLGPMIAETELRRCFAAGADHLCQIEVDGGNDRMDSLSKSEFLARAVKELKGDIVLCGKESQDNQSGQVGAFMAHELEMPFVSAITDITVEKDKGVAKVQRSAGRGVREVIECSLPAVFSVDLGSYALRLPTYENKKKAWSFPVEKLKYEETTLPKIVSARTFPPSPRPKQVPAPDSNLHAYDRILELLTGSRVEKKGVMLTGSTESQVEGILSFLEEHGICE